MNFINSSRRISGLAVPLLALRGSPESACGEYPDLAVLGALARQWGLSLIQLLPLNDTGTGTSPYSALSACALHPIHISLKEAGTSMQRLGRPLDPALVDALVKADRDIGVQWGGRERVAYLEVLDAKIKALRAVWDAEKNAGGGSAERPCIALAEAYAERESWAKPYACFIALKHSFGGAPWWDWPRMRDPGPEDIEGLWNDASIGEEARFWLWLQVLAEEQLGRAARTVTGYGIDIMGDIPILLAKDSADVWYRRQIFNLDRQAGAPPDMYSPRGQNWGFPLYDWDALEREEYAFWKERLFVAERYYTAYRLDHVLGFFRIWSISAHEHDAFLGAYVPAERILRSQLEADGFSPDRITWITRPHVPQARIEEAERRLVDAALAEGGPALAECCGQELAGLRARLFKRIGNEALFLFDPGIRGTADIYAAVWDAARRCGNADAAFAGYASALGEWWADRMLYEAEPDHFVFQWVFRETTAWHSLSAEEQAYFEKTHSRMDAMSMETWELQGRKILGMLKSITGMQPFAEDLGAVPPCVPKVLKEMAIPGLSVVRWERYWERPGSPHVPLDAYRPYSVVCTSVHDSTSLRQWWEEEADRSALWSLFGTMAERDPLLASLLASCPMEAPASLGPQGAAVFVRAAALASSITAVFPVQDILACHETFRAADPRQERINVPGTQSETNWTYRMPVDLPALAGDKAFAGFISRILDRESR